MFTFKCCDTFSPIAIFSKSRERRKRVEDVNSIVKELELLQDLLLEREIIINRVLQQMKRILKCEHYILHQIDFKPDMHYIDRRAMMKKIHGLKDFHEFLKIKNHLAAEIKIDDEDMLDEYIAFRTGKPSGCINFVSKSFLDQCNPKFVNKYFNTDEPLTCTASVTKFDNIFGKVVESKDYFITNNIFGSKTAALRFPKGHPEIKSFIAIPFINENGDVYAIAGFSNSSKKLDHKDYNLIKPILNVFNRILPDLLY